MDELKAVFAGAEMHSQGQIGAARRFFREQLKAGDLDGQPIGLSKLKSCITNYLSLVSITLESEDSPHRIFESLNNTGMALTASDLIRNDIFMRIKSEADQNAAYDRYWYPMQERLKGNRLSDFFWRYLMKDGALPRYDEVFEETRKQINEQVESEGRSLTDVLNDLDRFSHYYARLSRAAGLTEGGSIDRQLQRLNEWEVNAAYPFMLTLLDRHGQGAIDDEQVLAVLRMIESYVVRRFVCGVPTNRLRSIFARMNGKIGSGSYVESCRDYLLDNEWPSDDAFAEAFRTARIYNSSRLDRTRLILLSLRKLVRPQRARRVQQGDYDRARHAANTGRTMARDAWP